MLPRNNQQYFLSYVILLSILLIGILYYFSSSNTIYTVFKSYPLHSKAYSAVAPPVRVLCLIFTAPQHFFTRAKAVHETWASRCDRHFFITEPSSANLTAEQASFVRQLAIAPIKNITPGYDHLTLKSNLAFIFAYENYFKDFDWFVKADDDTYVIVDHLKLFLSDKNVSEPVTYGYNFKIIVPKGYQSGGAGYVLSRESLRRFIEAFQDPKSKCRRDGGSEDVEIGHCLRAGGVYMGRSLDKENRELFHTGPFQEHFRSRPQWLIDYAENPVQSHYNCCSDQTISFHKVSPEEQHQMDFLLYRARSKCNKTR